MIDTGLDMGNVDEFDTPDDGALRTKDRNIAILRQNCNESKIKNIKGALDDPMLKFGAKKSLYSDESDPEDISEGVIPGARNKSLANMSCITDIRKVELLLAYQHIDRESFKKSLAGPRAPSPHVYQDSEIFDHHAVMAKNGPMPGYL